MFSVKGKVVLLTGALGGIGKCFTKILLENGVKGIMLVDINDRESHSFQQQLRKDFGDGKTAFLKVDLSDPSQIELAYEKTIAYFKQLDIVINNAGALLENNYLKGLQINFVSVLYSTHLAFEKYLQQNRISEEAVVINIASVAGLTPFPAVPGYSPCKHGIVQLGRCYGHDVHYNTTKIRILTICPGTTNTPILEQISGLRDDLKQMSIDIMNSTVVQKPENVATALMHLIGCGKTGSVWSVRNDNPAEEIDWTVIDKECQKYVY